MNLNFNLKNKQKSSFDTNKNKKQKYIAAGSIRQTLLDEIASSVKKVACREVIRRDGKFSRSTYFSAIDKGRAM